MNRKSKRQANDAMWKHITLVRFFYWLSTGSVYYLLMHIGSIQLMIIPGHLIYFFNGQEIHLSALGAKRHPSLTLCVYDLKWMWTNHALGPPWGSLWCRDIDVMTSEQTLWGITHSCSQRHGDGTQYELFFPWWPLPTGGFQKSTGASAPHIPPTDGSRMLKKKDPDGCEL